MSTLKIFIPTRGRLHRQKTQREWFFKEIYRYLTHDICLVVPECEASHWSEVDAEINVVPDHYKFSDVRQHILQDPEERHLVLDDDLFLYRRKHGRLEKATLEDVVELLQCLDSYMDYGYIHGGIGFRAFNNQYADDNLEKENMVCICAHFYRSDVLRVEEFRYDAIPGKCDLHSTLSLLELGYPNIVTNEWVHHQECGLQASQGGVARYRTHEFVSETSRILQRLHPEVVSLRDKTQKDGSHVVETRIQWKKAFCLKEHLRRWTT